MEKPSRVAVETLTAMRRRRIGEFIGRLSEAELGALAQGLIVLTGGA